MVSEAATISTALENENKLDSIIKLDLMKFLFVIDPIKNINPLKDSSAALMQASSKKNIEIWSCTPQDLEARGDEVWASSVKVEVNSVDFFQRE